MKQKRMHEVYSQEETNEYNGTSAHDFAVVGDICKSG